MNYFLRRVKQPYFKVALFFYLALLLGGAQPAGAALISASAAIDWSSFKITPIDIGNGLPTLTWNNQNDFSQAYCCIGTFDSASNWSTGTLATDSGPASIASASTSVNQIKADASINFFPNQILAPFSNSQRLGHFSVQGNGVLLFQANYSLAGDVDSAPDVNANSSVSFNLFSLNNNGRNSGSADQSFNRTIVSGDQPFTETGILATALLFQDGWSGAFDASASASVFSSGVTPVPLPAAFWLFGSALAGVAALRRPAKCTG